MGRVAAHVGKFDGHSVVGSHRRRDSGAASGSSPPRHQIDASACKTRRNPTGAEQADGTRPFIAIDGNGRGRPGNARRDACFRVVNLSCPVPVQERRRVSLLSSLRSLHSNSGRDLVFHGGSKALRDGPRGE